MDNFYIVPNSRKKDSEVIVGNIIKCLSKRHIKVTVRDSDYAKAHFPDLIMAEADAMKVVDCIVVIGGDGTILHYSRKLSHYGIPFLGINIGNLGFLAEMEAGEIGEAFDELLEGNYIIEKRMMLKTIIDGEEAGSALNDVVLSRGGISRMVSYQLSVNEDKVNEDSADGIIVATPTGSTAYNLSAGGPIIVPDNEVMVVTPICPHSLTSRSIVINGTSKVKLTLENNRDDWKEGIMITLDGQESIQVSASAIIEIEKNDHYAKLIKIIGNDFYSVLRMKMNKKRHGV